jgi:LacI family transcriptional regulator, galactose operon repressor
LPTQRYNRGGTEELHARRPNLRDVAQLAGVAVSSASRVLSDHPDVSSGMRRRVLAAVEQLGYEPDFLAQSLRRGATFSVGFVVRDISSPLLAEIALGAETTLRGGGYYTLVLNSEADPTLDAEHIRLLERRRVDGVLISLADESNPQTLSALRELSIPSVLIDRDVWQIASGASAVLADHEQGMRAVVGHLAGLGHRTIGLVSGPLQVRPGREGTRAFRAICAELGVEAQVATGPFSAEHGLRSTTAMLAGSPAPTAIVSGSNQILPGVLSAIAQGGLEIPTQVSLATFDDLPLLGLLDPPVDVVKRDPRAFGGSAAELLLRCLNGEHPEPVLASSQFVVRGSSAPPPARSRPQHAARPPY